MAVYLHNGLSASGLSGSPPPPPPLPRPAPPPQVAHTTFYVAINHLNLRSCPGRECPKIHSLELNAEVEKMGETEKWAQIRVKKDGTIGYVNSRYLSPTPVEAAPATKKKRKKVKPKATQPSKPAEEAGKIPLKKPPSPGEESKPGEYRPAPPHEPEDQEIPKVM
jgi:hypothetical protein